MEAPRHWRLKRERYQLIGWECPNCGGKFLENRPVCPHCNGEKIEKGIGVAVLPITEINDERYVVFQKLLFEDGGKEEGPDFGNLVKLTPGMIGLLTGAVVEGEDFDVAANRELEEEFPQTEKLSESGEWTDSYQVSQLREGKKIKFRVFRGKQINLDGDFSDKDRFTLVKLEQITEFVKENKSSIRPAAHAVLSLLANS